MKKFLNFCIIVVFFITACTSPEKMETLSLEQSENPEIIEALENQETEGTEEEVDMQSNKVAIVVSRDRYQSLEFNPVVDALIASDHEIIITSDTLGEAKGTQESTTIDIAFANINTDELKAIVLIGGSNSLWDNEELHLILNQMNKEGKLVSAICYGSVTLARARVIGEGDIACWYNSSESDPVMESSGIVDSEKDVTIVGNIITGDGPNATEEFALAIVDYLKTK